MARLRALTSTPEKAANDGRLGITLPLILVRGSDWDVLLATDLADRTELFPIATVGNMASIVACYRVVALLRWLAVWSAMTFRR